jgi:hypothetical protein
MEDIIKDQAINVSIWVWFVWLTYPFIEGISSIFMIMLPSWVAAKLLGHLQRPDANGRGGWRGGSSALPIMWGLGLAEGDDGNFGSEMVHDVPRFTSCGGGSLRPASNPVYDNICVTWICRRRSCVYLVFVAIYVFISYDLSKGYPCLALYTQSG